MNLSDVSLELRCAQSHVWVARLRFPPVEFEDHFMAIVLWSGLRQMEALRSAFFVSLTQGGACEWLRSNDRADLLEWADREGIKHEWLLLAGESLDDIGRSKIDSVYRVGLAWALGILNDTGSDYGKIAVESTRTTSVLNPDTDYGPERSSAIWDRWDNFLTTSAMVRFMATLEQFEIDTLKALFYYRPQGLGVPADEHIDEEVEESIVFEKPESRSQVAYYKSPPLWTWIRPSAENNNERRQIFSRVYEIKFPQPQFGKKHSDLCEMRNAIAHGRDRVDITLRELIQIQCYVTTTMLAVRDLVFERYRLLL